MQQRPRSRIERRIGRAAALACALGLLACGPPDGVDLAPSDAALAGPPPKLLETARFDTAFARGAVDAARIEADSAGLAARAAALAARGAALSAAPVLTPAERARLEAAGPQ